MKKIWCSVLLFCCCSAVVLAGKAVLTEQGTLVKDGFHNAFPPLLNSTAIGICRTGGPPVTGGGMA